MAITPTQLVISRRGIVKLVAALPLGVAACGADSTGGGAVDGGTDALDAAGGSDVASDATPTDTGADSAADAAVEDATADAAAQDAAAEEVVADAAAEDAASTAWATGGTAAIGDVTAYPDPFAAAGATCNLTCTATIGPCHTESPERQDISDGWDGLPVRLELRVVDESCTPVEDAIVEIWHTNHRGSYSGEINSMCNETATDRAAGYFRGYQRTDADGRVAFHTCYPGWYSSRAVHIHFRVLTGAYVASDSAAAEVISQLFFTDELNHSIFGDEPLYSDFGEPDTTLSTDNVVGGEDDPSPYICDVSRMADGVMLASATLVLRSMSAAACAMQGAGGGGGGGQPPPP